MCYLGTEFTATQINQNVLAITLIPLPVIGIELSAFRINTEHRKNHKTLLLLKHKVLTDFVNETEALRNIELMKEKPFPPMTVHGIVELAPSFAVGIFGSLLIHGFLIYHI
ncbi:hypothetical protein AVEN_13719-1 [Araneus ventricosus]|uniref:Uncharacterized protein n=1 Tax=Araneus ventricosus TaxID=182803 RepID=A0A4Y2TQW4_ARAVE|nr:hypothetical protein AVEN_13719-1 [Araneus ventricosus]